jgi:hypothetical protein
MATYEVETDQGTYQLELDQELDDTPQNRELLQRLVGEQLRYHQGTRNTAGSLLTQALGGVRDAVQGAVDLPASIYNTVTEMVSMDPPGGPGPRRRALPEVQMPQLPDVEPPQTGLEKATRIGAEIATDVFASLAIPGVKTRMARLLGHEGPTVQPSSLMFEAGRPAARGGIAGTQPVPTLAKASGPLLGELSEGATNLASVLQLPRTMPAIRAMTQAEASTAVQRLLASVGEHHHLTQQAGPVRDLFDALQAQVLRYR